ncbi:MAG: site-specific integrase [Cyclobacteriaceae bacterium]
MTIKTDLFTFFKNYIEEIEKKLSPTTIQNYKNTIDRLDEYQRVKNLKLDFESIDLEFYTKYYQYLTEEINFSPSTIEKHLKVIKTVLNNASERGFNKSFKYKTKKFKFPSYEIENIYLGEDELYEMEKLDLSNNPRLEKVRDLFLVGCWTGLRFSDFSNILPENINKRYIKITTQKTGETVVIPLHPSVKNILNKYRNKYPNNLPPAISNAKTNKYIKEIGELIPSLHEKELKTKYKAGRKITLRLEKYKLITTHTARRSFATNLYLKKVPSITIMKITGHQTEGAFLQYIKADGYEHADLISSVWESNQFA